MMWEIIFDTFRLFNPGTTLCVFREGSSFEPRKIRIITIASIFTLYLLTAAERSSRA